MIAAVEKLQLGRDEEKVRKLLADPDTDGIAVYLLALDRLGAEALHGDEAEMAEAYQDLERMFSVRIPVALENKLQAVVTLVSTDAFFDTPHGLHAIANALTQGDMELGEDFSMERATWEEIQWAAFCASLLRDDNEEADFETPVLREMIRALKESGDGHDYQVGLAAFMAAQKEKLLADLETIGIPKNLILQSFTDAEKGSQAPSTGPAQN